MFEDRRKGRSLTKITSYGYVIIGVLLLIVTFALNNDTGIFALAQRGANIYYLAFGSILYIIFAGIIYFLSTKYENDDILWKIYIVMAILNFIVIGFSIIILIFSLLLVVAANDIRQELI